MLSCPLFHQKYESLPKGELINALTVEEKNESSIFQDRYPITWSVMKDKFITKREFKDVTPDDEENTECIPEIVSNITVKEPVFGFQYTKPTKRIGGGFNFSVPQSDASFALSLLKIKIRGKSFLSKGIAQVVAKKRDVNTLLRKKPILAKKMLKKKEIPKQIKNFAQGDKTSTSVSPKLAVNQSDFRQFSDQNQNQINDQQLHEQNQIQGDVMLQPQEQKRAFNPQHKEIQNKQNGFGKANENQQLRNRNRKDNSSSNQNIWGEQNIQADPNLLIPPAISIPQYDQNLFIQSNSFTQNSFPPYAAPKDQDFTDQIPNSLPQMFQHQNLDQNSTEGFNIQPQLNLDQFQPAAFDQTLNIQNPNQQSAIPQNTQGGFHNQNQQGGFRYELQNSQHNANPSSGEQKSRKKARTFRKKRPQNF